MMNHVLVLVALMGLITLGLGGLLAFVALMADDYELARKYFRSLVATGAGISLAAAFMRLVLSTL